MKISIFGLGYVGCVSLGCLAQNGNDVIGVDINEEKVKLIQNGKATIVEAQIDEIIKEQKELSRISATLDSYDAVQKTDISFICVGTPSTVNGHLDLSYIYQTAKQIGESIKDKSTFHIIIIRSTVLPGTNYRVSDLIGEVSGKVRNIDFAVVSNPEFLREGTAVKDYYNPAITVYGSDSEKAKIVMREIYTPVDAPIEEVSIEVAEIIKYINNTYHALKICFANEVGNICKALNIDSHNVMDIFCKDDQLNISSYYFKPGFAYGGSCLPKDMKALRTISHDNYLESPIINSIESSNKNQKEIAISMIEKTNKKNIGIIGLSFKAGTDDLRYSPSVDIVEFFIGKGYHIKIWDKNVHLSKLIGSNKNFISDHIPHIEKLISDNLLTVLSQSDVILITQKFGNEYEIIEKNKDKIFIDVIRVIDNPSLENYIGICW